MLLPVAGSGPAERVSQAREIFRLKLELTIGPFLLVAALALLWHSGLGHLPWKTVLHLIRRAKPLVGLLSRFL